MRKQLDLGKFWVHLEPDVTNLFNVISEEIFSNHIVLGLCFVDEGTQVCKRINSKAPYWQMQGLSLEHSVLTSS